jgi:hypothetical protein
MKKPLRIVALLLCPALFSLTAFAYCRVPEIKANGEFFKSDLVFTGTVLSERYRDGPGVQDNGGWYYRIRVLQIFKGPILKQFTVYTEDASNRFPLEKGRDYLLFAYRWHGRLEIDGCGNSALLSDAAKSIQQIRSIATTQDGEIEGWLAPETAGVDLSGIHVVIRSGSQVYRALTDEDGYFQFRAPKGSYVVDFSNHEYYLNGGDEFWYGPVRFRLHAGESGALQMVSVRHPKK